MRRRSHLAALLFLPLVLGCFEEPVREQLTLTFTSDRTLLAAWEARLTVPEGMAGDQALLARLDRIAAALEGGWHPWLTRFQQLGATDEGAAWRRTGDRLAEYQRWAVLDDPAAVADLFTGTPVGAAYARSRGSAEVVFYPGGASRVTREERQRVEEALATFSGALSSYLEAAAALWEHMDTNPHRRRACLAVLFEVETGDAPALTPAEEPLVEALADAIGGLFDVVILGPGEAETLDELSRRLYDPFPLDVVVEPGGTVLEVEGFRQGSDGRLRAPRLSLWSAFADLEGLWLAPDPAVAFVRHVRAGEEDFPLSGLLAQPFTHETPPPPFEVREALETALEPPELYRVVWRDDRGADAGDDLPRRH